MVPLVYLTCSNCGRRIAAPFSRISGPVVFLHRRARAPDCRLLVIPDTTGHDHRVRTVPPEQTLEQALLHALAVYITNATTEGA